MWVVIFADFSGVLESRGNNYTYSQGGNNIASSTLHFGPDGDNDGWWRNNVKRKALHTTYSAGYNVFGVEVREPICNLQYLS